MEAIILDDTNGAIMASNIRNAFRDSRFTLDVGFEVRGVRMERHVLKIKNVRLKDPKKYCGSHPYACDIDRGRRSRYLEGADWVEFNDLLNDVFDLHEVSANISSSVCKIRKGRKRRMDYDGHAEWVGNRVFYEWDKDTDEDCYEDWCGKIAPNSTFPEGTPGIYSRTAYERWGDELANRSETIAELMMDGDS